MNLAKTIETCNSLKAGGKGDIALKKIQNFIRKSKSEIKAYIYAAEYAESCNKHTLAENYYLKAIKRVPDDAYFYLNYARFKIRQNQYKKALNLLNKSYSLDNSSDLILTQLGRLNLINGKTSESLQILLKALEINPNNAQALYLLSLCYLKSGDYEKGFKFYALRHNHLKGANLGWKNIDISLFKTENKWKGEDLNKKTLLIMPEQGFGDFIMFFRYIRLIKDLFNVSIVIVCDKSMERLISNSKFIDKFLTNEKEIDLKNNSFDFWATVFDLPSIFLRTPLENFKFPYLFPKKDIKKYDFLSTKLLNIGIVWRGSSGHSNDIYRSIKSIELIKEFSKDENFNFISLQYDIDGEEKEILEKHVSQTNYLIEDFNDTANIILELDLVISVDTSVVHLCGALDKACWVLLPDINSDWRWHEEGSNSPWYPSVRIFRNHNEEGWELLLKKVKSELINLL